MIKPVAQSQSQAEALYWEAPSKQRSLAELIVQIAIRVIFIGVAILTAAAVVPLSFQAVILPLVAVSATILAGFFYPEKQPISKGPPLQFQSFIQPVQLPPAEIPVIPVHQPRGLNNRDEAGCKQDCAFIALIQNIRSVPPILNFLNARITQMDLPTFQNFLRGHLSEPEITAFVATNPAAPVHRAFIDQFLANNRFIKEKFEHIQILQEAFHQISTSIDAAVQNNQSVATGDTQIFREALHQIRPGIPIGRLQADASEALGAILELMPTTQMLQISGRQEYRPGAALPPPRGVDSDEQGRWFARDTGPLPEMFINVQFPDNLKNDDKVDVLQAAQRFFEYETLIEWRDIHGVERSYPTTVRKEFVEFPPFLTLNLARYKSVEVERETSPAPVPEWLYSIPVLNWILPEKPQPKPEVKRESKRIKLDNKAIVPEYYPVRVNGVERLYRFVCSANHDGTELSSGHYTATGIVNGQKFLMNDENVTIDPEKWDQNLAKGYLLFYLPVQPG
jgi:hypothetical protein